MEMLPNCLFLLPSCIISVPLIISPVISQQLLQTLEQGDDILFLLGKVSYPQFCLSLLLTLQRIAAHLVENLATFTLSTWASHSEFRAKLFDKFVFLTLLKN